MKKTQERIVRTAIQLFNKNGVANVRVQDIAVAANISPGNLTYHYKTKKDLMEAVLRYMKTVQKELFPYQSVVEAPDWLELVQAYLRFQIQFRFFYRDILEIASLVPDSRKQYKKQIEGVINFNRNGIYISVDKGFMLPEAHERQYQTLATHAWAILNAWLTVREVLGEEVANINRGIYGLLELHYPYLTEKGQRFYHKVKEQVPQLVKSEIDLIEEMQG
ncbi:MAG: TetR/AcrR family transcriptional regulator [Bacteroidota bacterium]